MVAIRVRKKKKPPRKASEWIKRKLQVNGFQESSDHIGTPYLVNQYKPVLCNAQLLTIVHAVHVASGCRAKTNMAAEMRKYFFFSKYSNALLLNAIREVKCKICERRQKLPQRRHNQSIFSVNFFERMDTKEIANPKSKLLSQLKGSHGYRYLLTAICTTTKVGVIHAIKTLGKEECNDFVVKLFERNIVPDILHTDNHGQFVNDLMNELKGRLHFEHITGKVRTPEHQGQVERFNLTSGNLLFNWIANQTSWRRAIEKWPTTGIEFINRQYNGRKHSSIGIPPDAFRFGRMRNPAARQALAGFKYEMLSFLNKSDQRFSQTITQDLGMCLRVDRLG